MSMTMVLVASEHTIRLPSGDQVPAGFDSHLGMFRSSVPSLLATNRFAPGPPISLPIMVTREPSGDSEPLAASAMPRRPRPNRIVLSPPATGTVRTTGYEWVPPV